MSSMFDDRGGRKGGIQPTIVITANKKWYFYLTYCYMIYRFVQLEKGGYDLNLRTDMEDVIRNNS